jgi:hypothetical protein
MANVTAVYESAAEARAAMTVLQRRGVEGAEIALGGPAAEVARLPITNDELRRADMAVVEESTRRAPLGAVVGALVLGTICAGIGAAVEGPAGAFVGLVAGLAAGLMLGFFYGGAIGLPANDSMADTYAAQGMGDDAEAWVEVHTDGPPDDVVSALRATDPIDLRVDAS